MTRWNRCGSLLVAALLAGCATPPSPRPSASEGRTLYTFVVLSEEGVPIARAITSAAACPAIEFDGAARAMSVRALPGTMPLRATISSPSASKPSAFPVLTCEATIPAGSSRATIDGRVLSLPKPSPRTVVVIGDSGCRMANAGNAFQACNDPQEWPFAAIASAAVGSAPDLVIHVGDYHYRENACPPDNVGCAGSVWGYGWDAWEADFFVPAGPLLAAAPWIVVRGNHESCARAGQGWWRFLDPRPLASRQDCNEPADDAVGDFSEPYAVPLGPGSDTQFIVFDSSRVGIVPLQPESAMYANYRVQFERAFNLGTRRPNTFFMNHHPILAFAPNPSKPESPYPGNAGLQSVLQAIEPAVLFPPDIKALISGHVHLFEVVSFSTPHPAQFVSGIGGDWVDAKLPLPLAAERTPAPAAIVAGIVATNRFGYMTMQRDGAGWTMTARSVKGEPMTTCTLFERRADCAPSGWLDGSPQNRY
jgi:Calcineurin-like phosphoesterase